MSNVEWVTLGKDSDIFADSYLFYGASGSGKSTLLSQFPKVGILATDPGRHGGVLSGRQFSPRYIKIKTYDQLMNVLPQVEKDISQGEILTLGVDSISYLQKIVMSHILQRSGREQPRFDEWGLCVERMRVLINRFADLSCVTVFTATENITKDEITGKLVGGPELPGKLKGELPQACDVVVRLFAHASYDSQGNKIVKYRFQSTPDDTWVARDRTTTLPPEGEVPKNDGLAPFKHLLEEMQKQK